MEQNSNRKSVLVTGGGGFVGSALTKRLLDSGYDVTVLDHFKFGAPITFLGPVSKLTIIRRDIRYIKDLRETVQKHDYVIHLAAVGGYNACDMTPDLANDVNVRGTKNILNLLRPDQPFIFASSCSCYGNAAQVCDEETIPQPLSLYAVTKVEGEKLVLAAGKAVLRFPTLYGLSPKLRLDLIVNNFCYQAVKTKEIHLFNGHYNRPFLHIEDACSAYKFTLERYEEFKGKITNVGGPYIHYTIERIAEIISKEYGAKINHITGNDKDKRNYEVEFKKIEKMGYAPKQTIETTVKSLLTAIDIMSVSQISDAFYITKNVCFASQMQQVHKKAG